MGRAPAQLPREHRGFVGRESELSDLGESLSGQDSAIGLLVGPAGAGKTYAFAAAREAWQSAGYRVIGAAPTALAADELQLLTLPADALALTLLVGACGPHGGRLQLLDASMESPKLYLYLCKE